MVDAAPTFEGKSARAHGTTPQVRDAVTVAAVSPAALSAYADLCDRGVFAPPQSLAWVGTWLAKAAPDMIIATLHDPGRPGLALALEVERSGPFKIARLPSGRHANGNFPVADPSWLPSATAGDMHALVTAIRQARRD